MAARGSIRPTMAFRALRQTLRPSSSPRASPARLSPSSTLRQPSIACLRPFHSIPYRRKQDAPPAHRPPTDLGELDVLGNTPVPATSVDVCMYDGFGLNSGVTISDGDGVLLIDGEVFRWRPWEARGALQLVNEKGQFDLPAEAFALFDLLWPRPDLLIVGVGKSIVPLSPATRKRIAELGMRVEVLDTRNAAAQFNLLATERGVSDVAAALIPIGWKEGVGAK